MGGSAIVQAAGKLKDAIRAAAAKRWDCAAEDVAIDAGKALGARRHDRCRSRSPSPGSSAEGTYASNKRTYSYGAHAAHVAVDPKTGQVELLDYVAVEDVGRIINPLTLHGQTVGAIVQGLGGALPGTSRLRRGRPIADRLVRRLSAADRERLSRRSARMALEEKPVADTIRSAPRARARAASSRSAA